jgi:hypothetical protein
VQAVAMLVELGGQEVLVHRSHSSVAMGHSS